MKRFMAFLLALLLAVPAALADPLPLSDEDLTETITVFYNGEDDSDGRYVWSCRYPVVSEDVDLSAVCVNEFYRKKVQEYTSDYIPSLADYYAGQSQSVSVDVSYEVTCNNDDYFSVLIRKEETNPDLTRVSWTGNVFSRKEEATGNTFTLPKLLGILESTENDETVQEYKTRRADELIRTMVWDMIQSNEDGIDYGSLTEEDLTHIFFPEESFYLDENGDPVFYIQPGNIFEEVPEGMGLLVFPIPLEDILDEL